MLQIFGSFGWIGSNFAKTFSTDDIRIPVTRDDYEVFAPQVINFISTVHNYNVFDNPFIDVHTNLTILIRILDSWKTYLEKNPSEDACFNFISSWFVYGNEYVYKPEKVIVPPGVNYEWKQQTVGAKEFDPCNPRGFYSITKRAAEQLLISYCETFNLPYRIIRLANVLGSGDTKASKKKNALLYLIGEMRKNEPIELYENGQFTRDYIDINDCIEAIKLILEKGNKNEIFNVGSGRPYIFDNLIRYAHSKLNSASIITSIEQKDFHKTVQVKDFYMNIDKLLRLGFEPKTCIFDTLDRIIQRP